MHRLQVVLRVVGGVSILCVGMIVYLGMSTLISEYAAPNLHFAVSFFGTLVYFLLSLHILLAISYFLGVSFYTRVLLGLIAITILVEISSVFFI